MNVIFIAPPAAGKGTFSSMLKDKYGYTHISAGDVLRDEIKSGSELGKRIEGVVASGALVDDDMLKELLLQKFKSIDLTKPYILDGYPRKLNQVKHYEEIVDELGLEFGKVIFIDIEEDIALERIFGRLNCPNCKRSYNKFTNLKPIHEGVCDVCNTPLISRTDDNEESFKVRFNNYLTETEPLIIYFKNKNNLNVIEGNNDSEVIFKQIEEILGVN